jgi:tRNA (guanine37-N1)-methyltransferase
MKITILTLFPKMFEGPFSHSIVKHAVEKELVEINIVDIRSYGIGAHKTVDDKPYGGGIGMVLRVDVLANAIEDVKKRNTVKTQKVILLDPDGKTFTQKAAKEYADIDHLILVCGHYEGIDERIKDYVDEIVSIGEFITTGGEIPAMLITDSVTRLVKGVLKEGVTDNESFSFIDEKNPVLEYPHYTRPDIFKNKKVPPVLLSGDHKEIDAWRQSERKNKSD